MRRRRNAAMIFLVLVGALFVGYGTAYVVSDDVRYLTRAGFEETRILQARQPIERLIRDSSLASDTRASLSLVLQSRDYAAALGLEAKKTYTTFADVGRDTLLMVLSASPKDCLCPHTWKYPIVGRVPYKGFFDFDMARDAADEMERRGYDTYLRPSAAFSTLGWFNDPLLSTALERDSTELSALVFHEIAHNTLYVKSATPFNESFAQMVGYRAAQSFFQSRGDSARAERAAGRWHDEVLLSGYYTELSRRLDSIYGSGADSTALDAGRSDVARWAREQLQDSLAPRFRTYRIGPLTERPINNARIIAARIYRTRLDLFEAWFQHQDQDIADAVRQLEVLESGAIGDEAYQRLERALDSTAARGSPVIPDTRPGPQR
ncbi:MAG TPA: aminopeptidase [Gemmatimonadales bacterium]|nr:aminopeptidase [Gemmatimonadales bacterium]